MRESEPPVTFLTVNEVAAQSGHHPATIRRWAAIGKIDAVKSGRDWLLTSEQAALVPPKRGKR